MTTPPLSTAASDAYHLSCGPSLVAHVEALETDAAAQDASVAHLRSRLPEIAAMTSKAREQFTAALAALQAETTLVSASESALLPLLAARESRHAQAHAELALTRALIQELEEDTKKSEPRLAALSTSLASGRSAHSTACARVSSLECELQQLRDVAEREKERPDLVQQRFQQLATQLKGELKTHLAVSATWQERLRQLGLLDQSLKQKKGKTICPDCRRDDKDGKGESDNKM